MRIEPIVTPTLSAVEQSILPSCKLTHSDSSMESLKCSQKNQFLIQLKKTYLYIKEKLIDFYKWIIAKFFESDEERDVDYIFIGGADNKKSVRLIRKGKDTGTAIHLGRTTADLTQIDIRKKKDERDLPELLDKLISDESIEAFKVGSLEVAFELWKARLRTDAQSGYKLSGTDAFNKCVREVLTKAMENPLSLSTRAREALLRIEYMMIEAIVDEYIDHSADASIQSLHQGVTDAKNQTYLEKFNSALCRRRIDQLEAMLNYRFDLHAISRKAALDKNERFIELFKMIPTVKGAPLDSAEPFEFSIFIEDLCELLAATKIKPSRAINNLPAVTFTRRV